MKRYASIDTAKGFGILAMLIVHTMTQQLGDADHDAFIPVIQSVSPYALLSISPVIILGVWGSFFTLLTCATTAMRMFSEAKSNRKDLHRILESRILIGFFIMLTEKWAYYFKHNKVFEKGRFIFPSFGFRYHSDTTDSIVYVSILISIILLVFVSIPVLSKPSITIVIFTILAFISLYYSDLVNLKSEELYLQFDDEERHILRLLVSKIYRGRFKLSQTFAFGAIGVVFGTFLSKEPTLPQLRLFSAVYFALSFSFFIGFVIKDWTFLLEFVSEDVPFELQFFNLGGQCLLLHFFLRNLDYGAPARKMKWRQKTIWLRRYGIVSLTLYALGPVPQDILMEYVLPFWGEPIVGQGANIELNWEFIQIYYLFFLVIVMWEILLRLWEKLDYIFSMEWIFSVASHIFFGKKSAMIGASKILYKPCSLQVRYWYPPTLKSNKAEYKISGIKRNTIIPLAPIGVDNL